MNKINKTIIFALFTAIFVFAGIKAQAYNPNLSVNDSGGGNVNIFVNNGSSNSSIQLAYTLQGSSLPAIVSNFGTTDYSGNFSTTVSASAYGIYYGSQIYVVVGGVQSNTVTLGSGGTGSGNITLNPSSLNLNSGQSSTVYISNNNNYNYNNNYYVSNNSNSNVATASISGNNLYVYGSSSGSTTITVCQSGYSSSCGYLYVSVNGGGTTGNITFSPANPNVNVGQTLNVYVSAPYSYSGTYYISGSFDSNIISASISGNNISLYGRNNGSTNIQVCQNSSPNSCATLYATVNGNNSGNITLSPSSLNLNYGQSSVVYISSNNYNYNYYISNNSNSSVATASVSGSNINVYGNSSGSTTITVCQNGYSSNCGYLYVNVSGSNSGSLTLSPSSLNLNLGQNSAVYVSGGYSGSYYVYNNSNNNVATASISGNNVSVYGNNSGSTTITICQNNYSHCAYLYVTVSGGTGSGNITLNPSSLNLNSGQSSTIYISSNNNNYNYYISNNSNSNVATASISGNNLYVYGSSSGSTTITVCQSGYSSSCGYLYVNVNGGSSGGSLNFTSTSLPQFTVGQYYSVQLLAYGGNSPYNFSLVSGSLPQGFSLNSLGQIFGTSQNSQSASFTVRVGDNFGRSATANFTLSPGGSVAGVSAYGNGSLISENGTVYIVYKNTKIGFSNASAFTGLGFRFSQVMNVSNSGLVNSGFVVTTSRTEHPWGSWIKSGNTVYFSHENGLIPIPDWNTFVNNGGSSNFIVSANSYDFQRPILSVMVQNDARLR